MSPPTGEARQLDLLRMTFVHKAAADRTRSAIEIFVTAPHCEVDVPIMQTQRHIADGVRQIESHYTALLLRYAGDGGELKILTAEILHAGQQHRGNAGSFAFQQ